MSHTLGLHKRLEDAKNPRKPVVGSWLVLPGASLARMTAQMGYDFVIIDCEHGDIADADMHVSVGAVAAQGVSPIVRIPAPENWLVKRALDTGAHALLCPMMSTADEARAFVSYAKFPVSLDKRIPGVMSGIRGVGSPFAPAAFGQTQAEYTATANTNILIAVQIETTEGLSNCEEIAKVDGVGKPNDLASSMGYTPHEHPDIPEVQEAIKRVLAAAKAAGKYAGMFCLTADQVQARFEQGFDFMNLGVDFLALSIWNATELEKISCLRAP